MKKVVIVSIILALVACVLIAGCTNISGKPPVRVTYYYSEGCGDCAKVDADLKNLTDIYQHGEFTLTKYNVAVEQSRYHDDIQKYNCEDVVPVVIVDNDCISGYTDSMKLRIQKAIGNRTV